MSLGGNMNEIVGIKPKREDFYNSSDTKITYKEKNKRVITTSYAKWSSMKQRICDEDYHKTHPTYIDVTINPLWLDFKNFEGWFNQHYSHGLVLDKDLKDGSNKRYCPETCLFVSVDVNAFLLFDKSNNSGLLTGVSSRPSGRFQTQCNIGFGKRRRTFGTWNTEQEAHLAYLIAKIDVGKNLLNQQVGEVHKYLNIFIKGLEEKKLTFQELILDKVA